MNVLFVGNSFTHVNRVPDTVSAMFASRDLPCHANHWTRGGASFKMHWLDNAGETDGWDDTRHEHMPDRAGGLDRLLAERTWDAVVLQGASFDPVDQPEDFHHYGRLLAGKARDAGAKRIVLYQTWTRVDETNKQQTVIAGYDQLARELDAEIAPVGQAFLRAVEAWTDIGLYVEDGLHANDRGSYLSACVFFMTLTGQSPLGLPTAFPQITHQLEWLGMGEPCYTTLDRYQHGRFLQNIADMVVRER